MKRIFLTGMSGTGKSTVVGKLAKLGYKAVDLDEPAWSEYDHTGDWVWREDLVRRLLSAEDSELLFVSGCATNQVKFHPQFDYIILLSAPADVLITRLRSRTNNAYGKRPEEMAEVLMYLKTVEPRLRRVAGYEVETNVSLEQVVSNILDIAVGERP